MCDSGRNQVDTFLEQHGGPGIQHIGLFTQDIVSTVHTMANAGVQFFCPPAAYYTEVLLFNSGLSGLLALVHTVVPKNNTMVLFLPGGKAAGDRGGGA